MNKTKSLFIGTCAAATMLFSSCSITLPVGATSNTVGSKVGISKGTTYFQILAFGADASIKSAAKNGGITKISTVDIKKSDILGIIQTYETIVTGE
jgi:hypothetical protein